jgi:hypothetical protein
MIHKKGRNKAKDNLYYSKKGSLKSNSRMKKDLFQRATARTLMRRLHLHNATPYRYLIYWFKDNPSNRFPVMVSVAHYNAVRSFEEVLRSCEEERDILRGDIKFLKDEVDFFANAIKEISHALNEGNTGLAKELVRLAKNEI